MESRIDEIILRRVAEGEAWDFKETLYRNADRDVHELLKDVTSFANSSGGTIVLGIGTDDGGRASQEIGVDPTNLDQEISRMEQILRDSTDLDVSGAVRISDARSNSGKTFVFLDIEESPVGPHRIKSKGKYKSHIFVRRGRSSIEADTNQMRDLFVGRGRTGPMIDDFIVGRRQAIAGGRLPNGTLSSPSMVMHVGPRRSFGSRRLVDYSLQQENYFKFSPEISGGSRVRPNILGALSSGDDVRRPYNQIFFNGFIELFRQGFGDRPAEGAMAVHGPTFEAYFSVELRDAVRQLEAVYNEGSYPVFVYFHNIFQEGISYPDPHGFMRVRGMRPHLAGFALPQVTVTWENGRLAVDGLRELLDLAWRAWGLDRYPGKLHGE